MNAFEQELLRCIEHVFRDDINANVVQVATNRDETSYFIQETDSGDFVVEPTYTSEDWMVEIVKTTPDSRHVRIVLRSPDVNVMNEVGDHHMILRTMVELAKDILCDPPSQQYVSQGVIHVVQTSGHVEFIPRDRLGRREDQTLLINGNKGKP